MSGGKGIQNFDSFHKKLKEDTVILRERESRYNPKQENTHESHLMVQLLDVSVLIYLSLILVLIDLF